MRLKIYYFSIPLKTELENGNLAIGLLDYVKITFRTSVSCNLPTICASPPSLTPKQKKDYWEMRTEGTCIILYNIFHAPSLLIPTFFFF